MTDYKVGFAKDEILTKKFHLRNILHKAYLTIDKSKYDEARLRVSKVRFVCYDDGTVWEMPVEKFDRLKQEYDYGHGPSYMVRWKEFQKVE